MCDFLRAAEFTAKAIRSGFACVGAVVDAVAPLKPVFGHPLPNPDARRPPGFYTSMTREFAAEYGFPQKPQRFQAHTASDGGQWVFSNLSDGLWDAVAYPPAGDPYLDAKAQERASESPAVSATDAVEEPSPAGAPVPAGDVPHTIHGSPTFAVLQALLTEYAVDHGELRFDGSADHWSCQCGQVLPDGGDGAYAALRDHLIEIQTSALSFAIAEARNTQK